MAERKPDAWTSAEVLKREGHEGTQLVEVEFNEHAAAPRPWC